MPKTIEGSFISAERASEYPGGPEAFWAREIWAVEDDGGPAQPQEWESIPGQPHEYEEPLDDWMSAATEIADEGKASPAGITHTYNFELTRRIIRQRGTHANPLPIYDLTEVNGDGTILRPSDRLEHMAAEAVSLIPYGVQKLIADKNIKVVIGDLQNIDAYLSREHIPQKTRDVFLRSGNHLIYKAGEGSTIYISDSRIGPDGKAALLSDEQIATSIVRQAALQAAYKDDADLLDLKKDTNRLVTALLQDSPQGLPDWQRNNSMRIVIANLASISLSEKWGAARDQHAYDRYPHFMAAVQKNIDANWQKLNEAKAAAPGLTPQPA